MFMAKMFILVGGVLVSVLFSLATMETFLAIVTKI